MPDVHTGVLHAAGFFTRQLKEEKLLSALAGVEHTLLEALLQRAFVEGAAWAVRQVEERVRRLEGDIGGATP